MENYHYLNWRGNCATLFMPAINLLGTASLVTPRNAQCIRAAEVCRQSGLQMMCLLMKSICFLGTRSSAFGSSETIRIKMRANSQTRCNVANNLTTSSHAGTFRVISTARIGDTAVVLHAFQKKTQTTSKRDIELARARWSQLKEQ
jgi:Phage derived protein Gp49-like (DUF891)